MSTFKGILHEKEFAGVVIDYFESRVLPGAKALFLSHFHEDHMRGLFNIQWQSVFEQDTSMKLYCSRITKNMLLRDTRRLFGILEGRIVALEKHPVTIIIQDTAITVTPLRAGHCPGSLMFLFESCDSTVLYTGDFRLTREDIQRCKPLHERVGRIDSVYLDTTFANSDYEHFPTRDESKRHIVKIIEDNRRSNEYDYFVIKSPARTGNEYLMVELYKAFRTPIHVTNSHSMDIISCIEPLKNVVTSELAKSFIHFCFKKSCKNCPFDGFHDKYFLINPSALYFDKQGRSGGDVIYESSSSVRVAYSSHSSLNELAHFIISINPGRIFPSVIPEGSTEDEIVDEIITYAVYELGATALRCA